MIRQFHLARVARQLCFLARRDIEKHLVSGRRDHVNRTLANADRWPLRVLLAPRNRLAERWQAGASFGHNGF